ncbi:pes1 [Ecytonucleospora hepatopenaei]|uniref:Pes1 n=1 Tax=Ecytonucleospora hepatopenaei TaxID=646526 RepID=A0A1W0E770_9MICR|nr:pes1 [Ecytonucleospora hepatopenaei]
MTKFWFSKNVFITKKKAALELKVNVNEFNKLCVYCSILPIIPKKEKQKMDSGDDFYYRIEDIKLIAKSSFYKVFMSNKIKEEKQEKYVSEGMLEKAKKIRLNPEELIPLVKNRFKSFGESLCNVGESLSFMHLAKLFKMEFDFTILDEFYDFVFNNNLIKYVFLGKKGIFYQVNIEDKMVLWKKPYNLSDNTKAKLKTLSNTKQNTVNNKEKLEDTKYFNCSTFTLKNQAELKGFDKNKSYLEYGIPVLNMHVKLVLYKLKSMDFKKEKSIIFDNLTFKIESKSLEHDLSNLIVFLGGKIDSKTSTIVLCEDVIDFDSSKMYIHPQFVFDCLNKNELLNIDDYKIGKKIPQHVSPFSNIFCNISDDIVQTLSNTKKMRLLSKIKRME